MNRNFICDYNILLIAYTSKGVSTATNKLFIIKTLFNLSSWSFSDSSIVLTMTISLFSNAANASFVRSVCNLAASFELTFRFRLLEEAVFAAAVEAALFIMTFVWCSVNADCVSNKERTSLSFSSISNTRFWKASNAV